jgi:hypothetical protein
MVGTSTNSPASQMHRTSKVAAEGAAARSVAAMRSQCTSIHWRGAVAGHLRRCAERQCAGDSVRMRAPGSQRRRTRRRSAVQCAGTRSSGGQGIRASSGAVGRRRAIESARARSYSPKAPSRATHPDLGSELSRQRCRADRERIELSSLAHFTQLLWATCLTIIPCWSAPPSEPCWSALSSAIWCS